MKKTSATRATSKPPGKPAAAKPRSIQTLAELAGLVERDKGTVSRWLQREDWPFGRGPWERASVPKILRWVADNLIAREPIDGSDERSQRADRIKQLREKKLEQEARRINAHAATLETALARERGELMEAAEVEREWASIGAAVRNGFQALASQLVPLALAHGMPNSAAAIFNQQITDAVAAILRRLSSSATAEADEPGEQPILPSSGPTRAMDGGSVGGELPGPQPG